MPTSLKCCGLVPDNRSPADKDLDLPTGTLSASSNARNLGVTVDENLTFDVHARACSQGWFYHLRLRRIQQVRRFLDELATRQLLHAYGTSRLDYCNALFANSTVAVGHRLQRIQNSVSSAHNQPTHVLRPSYETYICCQWRNESSINCVC